LALVCFLFAYLPGFQPLGYVTAQEVDPKVETNLKSEKIPLKTDDEVVQREEEAMSSDGFSVAEQKLIREKSESHHFQAEVNRVMSIIINSLYSNKDIFLRELISNASDALDKIRFFSLTDPSQLGEGDLAQLKIQIKFDKTNRILTITDNGIGMTKKDLIDKLGTIAQSGTREFLEAVQKNDVNLIGQFGVGFYSAFLVAETVTVTSKHNSDKQYVWQSNASSTFSIVEDPRGNTLGRGTKITLHLKEDAVQYLEQATLETLIGKYSEFISFPIYLWASRQVSEEVPVSEDEVETEEEDVSLENGETEKKTKTKTDTKTVWDWELLNKNKPIWTRSTSEVTQEEYNAFYNSLTKDTTEPLAHIHFSGEGDVEFKSILYIPAKAPENMFSGDREESKNRGLKLYVKRVFISDEFSSELPKYINFLKGIVDSDNVPLNVSREILQQDKSLSAIKKKIIRKAIAMIQQLAEDPDKYNRFYEQYATNIKLGVIDDTHNRSRLAKLLKFHSSKTQDLTTLDEYLSRKKPNQEQIYYLAGESKDLVEKSPFLEKILKRGYEVLYLTEPIDEWCAQQLGKFDNKYPLTNVAKEGFKLDGEKEDKEKEKEVEEDYKALIDFLKEKLKGRISKVAISKSLVKTPSAISAGTFGVSANMERLMKAQAFINQQQLNFMKAQKTLEINPKHPIIAELNRRVGEDREDPIATDIAELMYDTALLHSGFSLDNPAAFANRIHKVMKLSLNLDPEEEVPEELEPEEPQDTSSNDDDDGQTDSVKDEL